MTGAVYDRRIRTTSRILFFLQTAVVSRAKTIVNSARRNPHRSMQRYELLVSLPAGYATSGEAYPVLCVLDGWIPAHGVHSGEQFLFEANAASDHRQCELWRHRLYGVARA